MSALGILGSLAQGYTDAAKQRREQNLALGEHQRDLQINLLDKLLADPSTPEEYKGTLLQQRIATTNANQYDKNGTLKLPSLDDMRQQLPPVQRPATPGPGPAPAIQLPSAPPGMAAAGTESPANASAPPSAALPPSGVQNAPGGPSVPPMLQMPTAPPTLPSVPIATPTPPPIATAGQFHPLSQQEQIQREIAIRRTQAQALEASGATPRQAAQLAGLVPPPHITVVPEGATAIDTSRLGTAPIVSGALGDKAEQYNDMMAQRWQVMHPKEALPAVYKLNPNSTVKDYQRAETSLNQAENAYRQRQEFDQRRLDRLAQLQTINGYRQDARTDKSYQYTSKILDDAEKPVRDATARLGRLQDTLDANSPQADALIAPELLTVMAGGQGSGLRMNEAEIARIVGGRSKWETLKANINKWNSDPNAARSITPDQDAQIRKLVGVVKGKLDQKLTILNGAREELLNTDDIATHKRIAQKTRSALAQIDMGTAPASLIEVTDPQGGVHKFNTQAEADKFKQLAGIK